MLLDTCRSFVFWRRASLDDFIMPAVCFAVGWKHGSQQGSTGLFLFYCWKRVHGVVVVVGGGGYSCFSFEFWAGCGGGGGGGAGGPPPHSPLFPFHPFGGALFIGLSSTFYSSHSCVPLFPFPSTLSGLLCFRIDAWKTPALVLCASSNAERESNSYAHCDSFFFSLSDRKL